MNPQNNVKDGGEARLQFVLPLGGGGQREMTATVNVTALNDAEQARFDAEIEVFLLQIIRQEIKKESSLCPKPIMNN